MELIRPIQQELKITIPKPLVLIMLSLILVFGAVRSIKAQREKKEDKRPFLILDQPSKGRLDMNRIR